ncbi:MAG: AraC family transcriptional regulator [Pseudomonadota bacterium]
MATPDLAAFWGIVLPPDGTRPPTVSDPYSLGFNFHGTKDALVEIEGRTERRRLGIMSGGSNGGEQIAWVGLDRPAECISVTVSDRLRRTIADELRAPRAVDLGDVYHPSDAVLAALAFRLRAAGRGGWPISALELDEIGRSAVRHTMLAYFGGRRPRANAHGLDAIRLARVMDYLDNHLAAPLLLDDLAAVATMSPYQFQRAFRRTTGLSPHEFQCAWRMNRAARLIAAGTTRSKAARAVGYTPGHGFRTTLRKYTGV